MSASNLLDAEGLVKRWPSGPIALDGISLSIAQHEVVAVVGPNGCGKSTLVSVLAGLATVDAGRVCFRGTAVPLPREATRLSRRDEEALRLHRTRVGVVFQGINLFPHLSVGENCMLGPRYGLQLGPSEAAARAHAALLQVGMQDSLRKRVTDLSGGQQQRVAIARALANKPEVLLLDEPTSALDPQRTREVGELLRELASARTMTLVVVTHDLRLVREVADRVLLLEAGRTAFLGSAEEFFADMHPAVQRFLVADRVGMGP